MRMGQKMNFSWFKHEYVAAFSTSMAAVAAAFSGWSAWNSNYAQAEYEMRQIMQSYITAYADVAKDDADAMNNVDVFLKSRSQARIIILSGLLVTLIDSMHDIDDERAKVWARFIKKIPGPLVTPESCLEDYAKRKQTVSEIQEARRNVMRDNKIKEFKCRDDYYETSHRSR